MGYKTSKQRDMIYDYMQNMHGHISAEELFQQINEKEKISLATIYRNLNILDDLELIKKIPLEDGYVYDKTSNPHYHFYCEKCHTLYDLDSKYTEDLIDDLAKSDIVGKVNSHEITLNGICKNCINK